MLINMQHKFVFVHVPKCAGTSIEAALGPLCDIATEWPADHWTMERACEIKRTLLPQWATFKSFAVVRNPWEHIHSDYYHCRRMADCVQHNTQFHNKCVQAANQSFADFVRVQTAPMNGNGVFGFYTRDRDGHCLVQQPVRFEHLSDEWPRLLRWLGLPNVALPRKNVNEMRPVDWREDYTQELIDLVAKGCAKDINRFGYSFHGEKTC